MNNASVINTMLARYISTSEGKAAVSGLYRNSIKENGFSSEVVPVINDLITMVVAAIHGVGIRSFDASGISFTPGAMSDAGVVVTDVYFTDACLYRESLYNGKDKYNGFTGPGVNDIVALFTKGYSAGRVRGMWRSHGVETLNKRLREGSPFIAEAVKLFMAAYPNYISVKFKQEWGGDL